MRSTTALLSLLLLSVAGPATAEHSHEHGHEHVAPHGGTLVTLGDHFAHLEVVLHPKTGVLRMYVLDGEAENGVRIAERSLRLKVRRIRAAEGGFLRLDATEVALHPVSNVLTGETVGDSSEFAGQSDLLIGAAGFEALLRSIEVKGIEVQVTRFDYPGSP